MTIFSILRLQKYLVVLQLSVVEALDLHIITAQNHACGCNKWLHSFIGGFSFLVVDNFELSMCASLKLNIRYDILKFTLESTSKTISTSNYNVLLLFSKI